jgi:hypothetical protein
MSGNPDRDAAILGRAIRAITDKCHVCGCEGDTCSVGQGEKCVWMDRMKTLCSNPRCIQVSEIQAKKFNRERRRGVRLVKGRVA